MPESMGRDGSAGFPSRCHTWRVFGALPTFSVIAVLFGRIWSAGVPLGLASAPSVIAMQPERGRSACPAGVQSGKAQCLLARASSGTLRGRRLPEGRPAGQSMPPRPPPFAPAFRPCGVSERRLSVPTSFINQIAESSRSGRTPLIWMAAVLAPSNGDSSTALPRDDERHYGRSRVKRPLDLPKWRAHSCLE